MTRDYRKTDRNLHMILPGVMTLLLTSCSSSQPSARDLFYHGTGGNAASSPSNASSNANGPVSVAYHLELRRGDAQSVPCDNRFAFKSGDAVRLHIKTNEPLYVYVLEAGSSGKKSVLYPQPGEDNRIEAGNDVVVPKSGEMVFDENAGTEHLLVGLTRKSIGADRALDLDGVSIDPSALTDHPINIGGYSVQSSFGNYELGSRPAGDGQVYVSNPDGSKPTTIQIALNHTRDGDSGGSSSGGSSSSSSSSSGSSSSSSSDSGGSGSDEGSNSLQGHKLTGKWAFLIGVDHFKDPKIPATGCTIDVDHITNFLRTEANFPSDHVIPLTDENATKANIDARMRELSSQIKPSDLVITYFATHGGDIGTGDPVIVAYDGYIPMKTMSQHLLSLMHTDRLVVIMDTCHSGNTRALENSEDYLRSLVSGVGKIIVAGCQPQETSLGGRDGGVFTNSLLEGWRSEKLLKRAFYFAQKRTAEKASQVDDGGKPHDQHPIIIDKDWRGNDVDIFQPT